MEIEPLTDAGSFDYGDPIGEVETIYTLHSELATFGESFGCRESSFRLSLAPVLLERLGQLVGRERRGDRGGHAGGRLAVEPDGLGAHGPPRAGVRARRSRSAP